MTSSTCRAVAPFVSRSNTLEVANELFEHVVNTLLLNEFNAEIQSLRLVATAARLYGLES